jgi:hypothetical protein
VARRDADRFRAQVVARVDFYWGGHRLARWVWDDCWRPGVIRVRVLRAFASGGR